MPRVTDPAATTVTNFAQTRRERNEQYRIADPKSVQVRTPPIEVRVGIPVGILGSPREDLIGRRVKVPGDPKIYLVDRFSNETAGFRRYIPNPATYNNLFRDWDGIIEDQFVASILARDSLNKYVSDP